MKLFAVYVGGTHARAHIEVHDMRFILAESIEATYPQLKRQWWGAPRSLHIDCWSELTRADGYRVRLDKAPSPAAPKLYYVNVGGYDPGMFTEQHGNLFVVAETESKAKVKALKTVRHWQAFHKDDMYEAERVFCVQQASGESGYFIHLEKIEDESPAPFTCQYIPIGRYPSEA